MHRQDRGTIVRHTLFPTLYPHSPFQATVKDTSSQLEAASARLADTTATVAALSSAAEEAQKELATKSQQIAQLQISLADAEEQLVSITAREARSTEAEARRCGGRVCFKKVVFF
jgi:septal ring factor EnvC (AmiA/AmiB activator)